METEIDVAFGGNNTAGFLQCVTKLDGLTTNETGTGNHYQKLSLAIDLLSKASRLSVLPAGLVFSISMAAILKQLGTTLITPAFPSGRDKIYTALLHYQDSELNSEAVGLKDLNEISDRTNETIVLKLEDRFPTSKTVMFLGKLKAKTYELLTQPDIPSAERATVYINLYFQLANLHTLVLWQVFCIKLRSGYDQPSTQGVLAIINENYKSDFEVLTYVTETSFQNIVFLTIFHPTENEIFLNYLRLHKIRIPGFNQDKLNFLHRTYNIGSIKWPGWRLEVSSMYQGPLRSTNTTPSDGCEFKFESVKHRELDNLFYIKSKKWQDYYVYLSNSGICLSMQGQPGPEGQWKFVKLEDDANTSKYILSTLKWPCHFMFMDFMGIIKTTDNLNKIGHKGVWKIVDT